MILKEEYKTNEVVKTLLEKGFGEEYIAKSIEAGQIQIIEKSAKEGDNESETKQEEDINKLEKEAVKKEEKVKEDEKDDAEGKDAEGKKVEKGLSEDILKSFGDSLTASIKEAMASAVSEMMGTIQKSMDETNAKIDRIGNAAPAFKGDLTATVVEKSMTPGAGEKEGQMRVSITKQRNVCKSLLEDMYDKASDDIKKSIEEPYIDFLSNPYADTVDKPLYDFAKSQGVTLCK